jgi:L-fuculose-phosphate aldolase
MVVATDGNASVRLANHNIFTTRSGVEKGSITQKDLVEVSPEGQHVQGSTKPSTELAMHLLIYKERPDINAVLHAHPVYATAFAVAGLPLDSPAIPEVIVSLGSVPLARYATPSTAEVPDAIRPLVKSFDAILLANHGVVTYGPDLRDAWRKMERVEQAAHIILVARLLGGERPLTKEQIQELARVAPASYGKHIHPSILHATKS